MYKFKTFCHNGVNILSGSIALGFSLIKDGATLEQILDNNQLKVIINNTIGEEKFWDLGLPKGSAEFLIYGNAHSANLARTIGVSARVGSISKVLMIFGDRVWNESGISEAIPFQNMPIKYNLAYGGPNYTMNTLGIGYSDDSTSCPNRLPNIELPDQLLVTNSDRPEVAGFEPYPFNWPQRQQYFVDYPEFNQETEFILEKTIPEHFNTAPLDQRLKGFFKGNEEIEVKNMHPFLPVLKSSLPKVRLRVFAIQKTIHGQYSFGEINSTIETLSLLPEWERGVLLYRISHPIVDLIASDIAYIYLALENANSEAQSVDFYHQSLIKQLPKVSSEETVDDTATSILNKQTSEVINDLAQDETNKLDVKEHVSDMENLKELRGIEEFFNLYQDLSVGNTHGLSESSINTINKLHELIKQMEVSKADLKNLILERQNNGLPSLLSGDEILDNLQDIMHEDPALYKKLEHSIKIYDNCKKDL